MRSLLAALSFALVASSLALAADLQRESGDSRVRYLFPDTGEWLTYRLHVPRDYDASTPYGLIVVLHGYGGDSDSPFDGAPADTQGVLQRAADSHHFIVVAPAGYTGHGDYGAHLRLPGTLGRKIVHSNREDDLALRDVMNVVGRVLHDYRVDRKRVFLMGNSMGMTGTLYLAIKYPEIWCAIGPSDGPPWPDFPAQRLAYLSGAFFVNGAKDQLARSEINRALADRVRAVGVDTRFVEIPGGEHGTAWYSAVPAMFDFFASHPCKN